MAQERNKFYGQYFIPVRRGENGFERVTSFTLNVRITPEPVSVTERGGLFTYNSV
ncbi:MAG: hypothetical protein IPJ82_21085 [Lewinellaceae bacterium]|nr:hypothetical protein [Lewinellaceae bacterium]